MQLVLVSGGKRGHILSIPCAITEEKGRRVCFLLLFFIPLLYMDCFDSALNS